jgi:predicted PurR-regulated permease PerM
MSPAPNRLGFTPAAHFLLVAGAFVVVIAGLKAAAALVTPFLLAVFIAVLAAPGLQALHRLGLPSWAAMLVIVALLLAVGGGVIALFTGSLNQFNANLPEYQARLEQVSTDVVAWLDNHGLHVSRPAFDSLVDPSSALGIAGQLIRGLGGVLTNALLILLTVVFILSEAAGLPSKLRRALPNPDESLIHLREVMQTINRYMVIKATTSLATGLVIWLWLTWLGVDFAVLWAMLAFLLNFVPNIGSVIAAIPAVLLALVQLGFVPAMLTLAGYMSVNILIGSFIEPKIMGRGLGLSTLVVFVSLIFWGFVLGPAGMFLSVPLTMALKIALDANPQTRHVAILLGPETEARQFGGERQDEPSLAKGSSE